MESNFIFKESSCVKNENVANTFKREATAIVTAVDSKFSETVLSIEDREKSLDDMILLALDSMILLNLSFWAEWSKA